MAIPSALTRQWELQLALNSPMAIATFLWLAISEKASLPLKKQAYHLKKASLPSATWNSLV